MERTRFYVDIPELAHIAISIIAICLSLAFAFAGLDIKPGQFAYLMAVFGITVGSGFVLHELAHKYFATKFGAYARYEAWTAGLVLMLALAIVPQLVGFRLPIFLAPGAVMIYARKNISDKENGIISVAGPITNLLIAFAFMAAGFVLFGGIFFSDVPAKGFVSDFVSTVVLLGARVNFSLAMFNLLPIPPLDGSKVIKWDWRIWALIFVVAWIGSGLMAF